MPYEPGSKQCSGLITAKDSLLAAISALNKLENVEHIQTQLKKIYQELDEIHEGRKMIENEI